MIVNKHFSLAIIDYKGYSIGAVVKLLRTCTTQNYMYLILPLTSPAYMLKEYIIKLFPNLKNPQKNLISLVLHTPHI